MKIDFVNFDRQYLPIRRKIDDAINTVIDRYDFVNGEANSKFEEEFSDYIGTRFCVGVGSGTDALILALLSLGIGEGDEVLVPDLTYISTLRAVQVVGATPIVVPCNEHTFCMDASWISHCITDNTKAIIYVHLYGNPGNFGDILERANRHRLYIIEDAAQAAGSSYDGTKCGALGDIGCFSFYPSKNLGCFGQGGAITTNISSFAHKARLLASIGLVDKDTVSDYKMVFNSRLDGIQAAILCVNLTVLDEWNLKRNEVARIYKDCLEGYDIVQDIIGYSNYHIFAICIESYSVDSFIMYCESKGVPIRRHYAFRMSQIVGRAIQHGSMFDGLVSLPMHPYLTEAEVLYTCSVMKEFFKSYRKGDIINI